MLRRSSALVDRAVLELLFRGRESELAERHPRVLVLLEDHWAGLEDGLVSVREIRRNAPSVRLSLWLGPELERRFGPDEITRLTEVDDKVREQPGECRPEEGADRIWLPVLPLHLLSSIARLDDSKPFARAVIRGLCEGKPVAAFRPGIAGGEAWDRRGWQSAPEMRRQIAEMTGTIRSYGVKLLDEGEAAEWAQGKSGRRPVITEADVKAAAAAGRKTMTIGRGAILTPLARDTAVKYGIVLTGIGWEEA
jgi:hypothetical protein